MVTSQSWLKRIDEALISLDERPQFGSHQPFPLERLQQLLRSLFKKPSLTVNVHEKGWKPPEELWQGLGENLLSLTIEMTPLQPPLYFVMSEQDIKELMGDVLGGDSTFSAFFSKELADGFYHYLALEVVQAIEQVGFAHPLSPRLSETQTDLRNVLSNEHCYLADVNCSEGNKAIWGRVLIPEPFRRAWKEHFAKTLSANSYDPKFPVEISLKVGDSEIAVEEFKQAKVGDVILLDRCTYDLSGHKGSATVMLGDQPIFRGKFKETSFELLEFPFEELGESMRDDEMDEYEEDFSEADEKEPETSTGGSLDVSGLPVNLAVEVARLKLTIKELSDLSPGSLLDLSQSPESGVALLINGKRIGRGELVQLGESVGVRITSI